MCPAGTPAPARKDPAGRRTIPLPEPRGGQYSYSGFENGPVAGAGLEFRTHFVTISPELRFSRLTNGYPRDNRFTALVGFTFGHKR